MPIAGLMAYVLFFIAGMQLEKGAEEWLVIIIGAAGLVVATILECNNRAE